MLKGVNQWCFPEGLPLQQLFSISREAGYDAVELNVDPLGGVGLTMETTALEAEAIGRLARDYGIQLRSLSTSLLWRTPLSSADASVREQGRRVVEKQLELAELLGIDTVLVVPGAVNEETSYDECYDRSRAELALLVKEAERRRVGIGIENVWNKFLLSPLEMRAYVDDLQSSFVGVYFDVGNILHNGYPQQWIQNSWFSSVQNTCEGLSAKRRQWQRLCPTALGRCQLDGSPICAGGYRVYRYGDG